jgi:hypothetical protein
MLGGSLVRLLPEVMAWLNKATDNRHELAMVEKQIELQRLKGEQDRATAVTQGEQTRATMEVEGDFKLALANLDAVKDAIKGQFQLTGIRFVDALNFLMRPTTVYYFLFMYGMVKVAKLVVALQTTDPWNAILLCWDADDRATLSGILGFLFLGRVFDKRK